MTDRFGGTTYDEVTGRDGAGRRRAPAALRRARAASWAPSRSAGRPRAAVACRTSRRPGHAATGLAADLGLDVAGQPDVRQEPDDTGWAIAWPRVVDGIPVLGDGVRVDLWPDGRVHAVVRTERPLASRPARVIDEATREGTGDPRPRGPVREPLRAGRDRDGRARLGRPERRLRRRRRRTPRPQRSGSPGSSRPARAASSSEGLRAVKLFLDAGSGALLGGDVLR